MHSHGIHHNCEKILKKWMQFASGLKNDWQELKYVIVVLFLHHHEQGNIVHHYNKGMTGAMHGLLISIVKAFARSTFITTSRVA